MLDAPLVQKPRWMIFQCSPRSPAMTFIIAASSSGDSSGSRATAAASRPNMPAIAVNLPPTSSWPGSATTAARRCSKAATRGAM